MKLKIYFLLCVSICQFANAQVKRCGSVEQMQKMMFNPLMKQKYLNQIEKSNQELLRLENHSLAKNPQITLLIPVAVHFPSESNSNRACLVALAQNQIDILNNDFNGTNSDISVWNNTTGSYFPGVNNGSIDVQFVLATQNHPTGTDPNLVNGQPAVTIGYDFAANSDWNATWTGYLNIVVDNLSGGTLGYAYLASDPNDGAAIFINYSAFASGSGCGNVVPSAPYNLGRTLTHELGHYLNLMHIWGDAFCGDDFVADTPLHNEDNYGCPSINHLSTCSGTPRELTMNYMDYTNDSCMYMFTQGQATRMQAHLNTIASNFNQNTLGLNSLVATAFSVFPNPNNGNFSISFENGITNSTIVVFDVTGRKVFEKELTVNSGEIIDVKIDNVNTGIYSVVVKNDSHSSTQKIIIK
ncbi:conserved exported hypothetical protein [Flavobacterium sp. 9AF]|uniref:M43 family zinc metalloprotease n=1 Tax=Flavobacterium sp. 9AF TaxID=2653142 RepID=UPI0012F0DBBB|nr:M43 family zinc metalloprotease [Flavobacterium sp. 9AF]VXB45928.1 conserved exported hypothetical protein [Flavobacterium sp. 9AF]